MKIRDVEISDVEQLVQLFDDYRVFYRKPTAINEAKEFLLERLKHKDSKIYVCEDENNQLVGFAQLYPLFSSTRMKKLWLLNDLFVCSKARGKGISKQLIERSKQLVTSSFACGLVLETEKSNVIGNSLYPKTGFKLNEDSNFYEWNP